MRKRLAHCGINSLNCHCEDMSSVVDLTMKVTAEVWNDPGANVVDVVA